MYLLFYADDYYESTRIKKRRTHSVGSTFNKMK